MKYNFDCGCSFDRLSVDNLNMECKGTWRMLQDGLTKGVFQLESALGRHWCKQVVPNTIEDLSGIISIVRPGVLKAVLNKKSLTQHYADRKNSREEIEKYHPIVDEVLKETYGILIYQESSIELVKRLAGFTLEEADSIRKALGKKDSKLISELKVKFLDKAKELNLIPYEKAEEVFEWIKKGERYSFNKCLHVNTTVETLTQIKNLKQVQVGEFIKSPYGWVQIINKYNNGPKELYTVWLDNYKFITATLDHNILCDDGELKTIGQIKEYGCYQKIGYHEDDEDRIKFCSIREIEYVGVQPTMDIEINHPSHIFYGNEIATSNSHSCSYATIGYQTAYIKHHFPLQFFTSWLQLAHEKIEPQKEVQELINEAKLFNIEVLPPDIRTLEHDFHIDKIDGKSIRFGLSDIKGVGDSVLNGMSHVFKDVDLSNLSWPQFLYKYSNLINKTSVIALIGCGALQYMGVSRGKMKYDFTKWSQLSDREQKFLKELDCPFIDGLKLLSQAERKNGGPANKNRREFISNLIKSLEKPPYSLDDSPDQILNEEIRLLGVPITYSKVDAADNLKGNCTCKEFHDGKTGYCVVDVELTSVRPFKIKKPGKNLGKFMAFLVIADQTLVLDNVVAFPDVWEENQHLLTEGNLVSLVLEKSKQNGSPVVKKASQL